MGFIKSTHLLGRFHGEQKEMSALLPPKQTENQRLAERLSSHLQPWTQNERKETENWQFNRDSHNFHWQLLLLFFCSPTLPLILYLHCPDELATGWISRQCIGEWPSNKPWGPSFSASSSQSMSQPWDISALICKIVKIEWRLKTHRAHPRTKGRSRGCCGQNNNADTIILVTQLENSNEFIG